jgi:multidrug efflux pump subunit AcrA (membrane-fusion protein)
VLVLLLGAVGCRRHAVDAEHEGAAPVEIHCVKPAHQTVDETTSLRGRIEPPPGGDLSVASQVPGRVVVVSVKEGDRVGAGDLVATVDDAPSRDALRQAEAALAQARATDVNAQAALERTKALVARGIRSLLRERRPHASRWQ